MIVLDTSVIFKWFDRQESDHETALMILMDFLEGKEQITVPDLTLSELTNAWATKTAISPKEARANLNLFVNYDLKMQPVTVDLVRSALDLAMKYKTSVYDATYAALARDLGCDLITADEKFVRQVNLPFVKLLGE